ncbi:Dcp1-like decapping family protein [Pleurostoma richardsiae]|uniref:Dcp1-like decapping family protein n=1 Tax=Pleurostoma richardsiae TaxID=41990 RepID=A0AA38RCX3_9PEZI|nr:Dcp1-like decapping family protein [Pleurostoma richardsiae]
MSRSTPRKSRHRHNPSSGGGGGAGVNGTRMVVASDYESDAAHYMETRVAPPAPHLLGRTNTELNLSVLQRYLPSVRSILSIAANAVVYIFIPETQSWDKSGAEGTLFVCEQEPVFTGTTSLPRSCVFVLNRRGLDNVVVDLAKVSHCEVTAELLIFKLEDTNDAGANEGGAADETDGSPKVVGIWIHADQDDTREVNAAIIQELWRQVRLAAQSVAPSESPSDGVAAQARHESLSPAMQAMGRKVSLTDLFSPKYSNVPGG